MKLEVLDQRYSDQCCTNLDIKCFYAGSDEGSYLQVLLQCLEEQPNLAEILIDCRYGGCTKLKMIGQKDDFEILFIVLDDNLAQNMWAFFTGIVTVEVDHLVS